MRRTLIRRSVAAVLDASAWLARGPLHGLAEPVMGAAGRLAARARGIAPTPGAREMAEAWQRAFPAKKEVPITGVEGQTAFAEIHTSCPLRGSGDLQSCHRMMAYDRAFAAKAGARFVVLRSQAEPGVSVCQVALRPLELPHHDLSPAHLRPKP